MTTTSFKFTGFMQPEVYEGDYFEIETTSGTEVVPADVVGFHEATPIEMFLSYLEGRPMQEYEDVIECKRGWLARLSAAGYLDATEWSAFSTQQAAWDHMVDLYSDEV